MSDTRTSLFDDWDVLRARIVPNLLEAEKESGQARVWAIGEVADAVAVAAAFSEARESGADRFAAFASCRRRQFHLNRCDLRSLPGPTRAAAFRRSAAGWVPSDGIARRIFLTEPTGPVDLVTVRSAASGSVSLARAASRLRPGGLLMVVDGSDAGPAGPALRPVPGDGRLYEKGPASGSGAARCRPSDRSGRLPEEGAGTLADWQDQADLVASHASLARSLARRFAGHGESRQDLDQVALLALVKAAGRFDPSRDISFSTFATATVLGELKRHFRDKTWMMRVPRGVQETYLAIKDAREALGHELSRSPTIPQIADRLGISQETVLEAMEAGDNYWPESLDVGIHDGDAGRDVPVADPSFDLVLEQHDLQQLIPRLAERERVLLRRLYFDGWTQRQVAQEIGVSQMHISRLLNRTIEKLRRWASDERFSSEP